MEVVPTSDGEEDDGVIWFRCPQCQGFLPKLSGADLKAEPEEASAVETDTDSPQDPPAESGPSPTLPSESGSDETMPWDSPAEMMAAGENTVPDPGLPDLEELVVSDLVAAVPKTEDAETSRGSKTNAAEPAEPVHEYAALLAENDQNEPTPYRPWETYEVGQCILHQAWEDCGIVVAKEDLPGGRQIIKCYFAEAGVVRLIEKAPR